jgi:hypothetical protein
VACAALQDAPLAYFAANFMQQKHSLVVAMQQQVGRVKRDSAVWWLAVEPMEPAWVVYCPAPRRLLVLPSNTWSSASGRVLWPWQA